MASVNPLATLGSQRKALLIALGVLLLVVLQLLTYQLWLNYREQIHAAETTTRNYAAIFETRLDATLRRTDAILQALVGSTPARALNPQASVEYAGAINGKLDAYLLNFEELSGLRIFDASGDLLYSSDQGNAPQIKVVDRDYFRMLREKPQLGPVFSEVIISRATERPSLIVARALQDDHGAFLGIVTAVLDLARYQEIFRALDLGGTGSIVLRRSDDQRLVVRWPHIASEVNQPLKPQHPVRQRMSSGETAATLQFAAQSDGIERIYSFHRLQRYPFYFIIGVSRDDVLAGWRTRALVVGISGFLLLALLCGLMLRLWRSEQREAQVLTDLVDSERRLRAKGERLEIFQRLVDNAGQGIGMAHPDGTLLYANAALRRLLDLPAEAACSDYSFDRFYSAENWHRLQQEVLPAVFDAGQWTGEINLSALDGRTIPTIHTLFVVRNAPGEAPIIANVLVDLSERQQMEERNRQLLAEMQTLLGNAMVGIVHLKRRRVVSCNRRLEELFGYEPGELLGQSSENFYASREIFEKVGAEAYAVVAAGSEFTTELMLRRKDGGLFWGVLTGRAIDPCQPQEGSIWVFADVSERRQAEEESQRLRQAIEQSPVAIVITNRRGEIEYVNPSFTRGSGYSRAEAIGRDPGFLKSGETPAETYRELWHTLSDGKVWSGLLHNRRKNGELFWESASISPVFSDHGEVTHYLAVKEDVTERLRADQALRESEEAFRRLFEDAKDPLLLLKDGQFIDCNAAALELLGYSSKAELLGRSPAEISPPCQPDGQPSDEKAAAMIAAVGRFGYHRFEWTPLRADGSPVPVEVTLTSITLGGEVILHALWRDISERKAAEEKISHLAHFDTLTDLPNRANLQGRLDQALAAARRDGQSGRLAVMFLDLDRFKNINDTLGHHVGDELLLAVSQRLRTSVRESDVVARLGGDEFVVVLTGAGAVAAERVAGKILHALSQTYHIAGHSLHTTSSIGIAAFPGDGESVEVLMRNADAAMYHAKAAGRNNMQFFTTSMNALASERRQLEEDLHRALRGQQFVLHYQPQVNALHRVFAAEALLRWQHPQHGQIPPGRFVPLAEDTGLIVPIGRWVLETACAQLQTWSLDARTRELQIAVNVSARQFRQADFVAQLGEILSSSAAEPARLKLELTESLVLDNVADTIAKMVAIKKLGVTFSMDDFGTGYSSLSYLTRLPLDQLKIDRAFVSRLPDNQSDAVIAQTIVTMGHSLGLKVIAEGVENEAQRQFLHAHDCDGYQGFLFSRPLPVEELERRLKNGAL